MSKEEVLPITRQCQLLDLARSSYFYMPEPVSDEELEEAIEALYNVNEAIEHEPQNIEHVKMKVMLTSKIAELEAKGMTPGGGLGKITSSYQLNLPPEYYMKQI